MCTEVEDPAVGSGKRFQEDAADMWNKSPSAEFTV